MPDYLPVYPTKHCEKSCRAAENRLDIRANRAATDFQMLARSSHLGGLLRQARKAERLTQAALAKKAGVGLSAVRAVEQSQGRVSTLNAILSALAVELRGRQLASGPIGHALIAARKRRRTSRPVAYCQPQQLGIYRRRWWPRKRSGGLCHRGWSRAICDQG